MTFINGVFWMLFYAAAIIFAARRVQGLQRSRKTVLALLLLFILLPPLSWILSSYQISSTWTKDANTRIGLTVLVSVVLYLGWSAYAGLCITERNAFTFLAFGIYTYIVPFAFAYATLESVYFKK